VLGCTVLVLTAVATIVICKKRRRGSPHVRESEAYEAMLTGRRYTPPLRPRVNAMDRVSSSWSFKQVQKVLVGVALLHKKKDASFPCIKSAIDRLTPPQHPSAP